MDTDAEDTVWPPKPTVLQAPHEYDDLLTEQLQSKVTHGKNITRLILIKELRDATILDARAAKEVVYDYCERKGVLPVGRASIIAWAGCLLIPIATGSFICISTYLTIAHIYASRQHQPHTVLLSINNTSLILDLVLFGVTFLMLYLWIKQFRSVRK